MFDLGDVHLAVRQIPKNVKNHRRRHPGEAVNLSCIGKLLLGGRRGSRLDELPKARSGIGKSPRWYLNPKGIKCCK
jgi:hypothetical protein